MVIPDHRTPVVTQMIWYKVGSADETPGKSGLAHFLEHLMFKGTAKHPAGEFSQTVLRFGGNENAFTSTDYTGYFQRVPRDQLAKMMEFEADRMTGLILKDENVLPERDVVLEEYNMRVANNPEARLTEQIMAALYLNHPYGRPVIGWHQEIEKLDREDALAFYRRFYAPNNATLVIAGDVDAEEVRPMAERTFGEVAAAARDTGAAHSPAGADAGRAAHRDASPIRASSSPSVRRYYLVPSATTAAAGESPALDVLGAVDGQRQQLLSLSRAGGRPAARRQRRRRLSGHLARRDPVHDLGLAEARRRVRADRAGDRPRDRRTSPRTRCRAEDLERVKTQLIAEAIYAQDNQATLARWYGAALTTGLSIDDIRRWPDRIRAVTADQVGAAAQKWLDKKRSVTGYLIKDPTPKREEKRS